MDTHTKEFGVRPFAPGVVRGLRTFRAPMSLGASFTELCAVSADYRWTAGENVADCNPPSGTPWAFFKSLGMSPHTQTAGVGCTCGFYAYFGDSNDYQDPSHLGFWALGYDALVGGIVEGYGVVTVGTRGFRAEKARIVALIKPEASACTPALLLLLNSFGVPVYDTKAAALAAHPTTKPEEVGVDPDVTEVDGPSPSPLPLGAQSVIFSASGGVTIMMGNGRVIQKSAPGAPAQAPVLAHVHHVVPAVRPAPQTPQQIVKGVLNRIGAKLTNSDDDLSDVRPTFNRGGWIRGVLTTTDDHSDDQCQVTPAEKLRNDKQTAAAKRQQAGLKGVGGFDKRGRRR